MFSPWSCPNTRRSLPREASPSFKTPENQTKSWATLPNFKASSDLSRKVDHKIYQNKAHWGFLSSLWTQSPLPALNYWSQAPKPNCNPAPALPEPWLELGIAWWVPSLLHQPKQYLKFISTEVSPRFNFTSTWNVQNFPLHCASCSPRAPCCVSIHTSSLAGFSFTS